MQKLVNTMRGMFERYSVDEVQAVFEEMLKERLNNPKWMTAEERRRDQPNPFYNIAPGVQLRRFYGADCTTLVGKKDHDVNPNPDSWRVYRIEVTRSTVKDFPWKAKMYIDTRCVAKLYAFGRSIAEHMAVSAFRRKLKDNSKRSRKGGNTESN